MSDEPSRPVPRYRRRILISGVIAAAVLFAAGAPIYLSRIESDLERRVPEALGVAGYAGVQASFSGQDGTLRCDRPLGAPQAAVDAAYRVQGVRSIDLDRSCRVGTAGAGNDSSGDAGSEPAGDSGSGSGSDSEPTGDDADFATIADILASDPQFTLFSVLVGESGIGAQLADPATGPVTLFVPRDAAFERLQPDALAQLRADDDVLLRVVRHHMVTGSLTTEQLRSGPLTAGDGGTLDVVVPATTGPAAGAPITVAGAPITGADLLAGNGVVQPVGEVLLPPDVELAAPTRQVVATLAAGVVELDGTVAGEGARAVLTDAAAPLPVDDALVVDAATGAGDEAVAALARLVGVMGTGLVGGQVTLEGDVLTIEGRYATDADRATVQAVADEVAARARLTPRPDATAATAADLQAELNGYVAEHPIRFATGSATLTGDAAAVLDALAARARRLGGVIVTVEGHTDSDGRADANLALSTQRAEAVRAELAARGLDDVRAEGFGSERPILVDGVEDKAASRRVELRVAASS